MPMTNNGLSKLVEELGELGQVAGKMLQFPDLMFDVKVAGVQVVNEPGKARRFGKSIGRTQDWKKAYVSLVAGQTIDYEARAKA